MNGQYLCQDYLAKDVISADMIRFAGFPLRLGEGESGSVFLTVMPHKVAIMLRNIIHYLHENTLWSTKF